MKYSDVLSKHIYCIGGATIDRKFKPKSMLQEATSNPVVSHFSYGGVARNVAKNLSQLTHHIHFQSVTGSDSLSKALITDLNNHNVDTSHCLVMPNHSTAHYYAILDHTNDLFLALADMEIYEHIPYEEFVKPWQAWEPNSIIFLDTNLPTHFIEHAIQLSTKKQLQLCIDPVSNSKAKKLPFDLSNIYMLKPNQYEASTLTDIPITTLDDCFKAADILKQRGVKHVVISLGAKGYIISNNLSTKHYNAKENIAVTDTNGAGDAFVAGILLGLQHNKSIEDSCQIGEKLAIKTIQTYQSVITYGNQYEYTL